LVHGPQLELKELHDDIYSHTYQSISSAAKTLLMEKIKEIDSTGKFEEMCIRL
jgi:hypothetical protein